MTESPEIVVGNDVRTNRAIAPPDQALVGMDERDLEAALPPEMSAETVYRALRAKILRLERRVALLEDRSRPVGSSCPTPRQDAGAT